MILDCRKFKTLADITEADIAKRLMDYGFHAPPFPSGPWYPYDGTHRKRIEGRAGPFHRGHYCIHRDIMEIAEGKQDVAAVFRAMHRTALRFCFPMTGTGDYSRERAAYPLQWVLLVIQVLAAVMYLNDGYGDRNLVVPASSELYRD